MVKKEVATTIVKLLLIVTWKAFTRVPVSSEISDFTPCVHAHSNILRIKYAEKTDD